MKILRLKINEIFELNGEAPPSLEGIDVNALIKIVLKKFGFLPQPTIVSIEDDEVVVQYPEESDVAQAEAERLSARAAKRAAQGDYKKAIGVYKRALEHQPSLHAARRDLAMVYYEIGDTENASNHLIEVLRATPDDVWSLVVLANLYIQQIGNIETGRKLLQKAAQLDPNDSWALNSLAAVEMKQGSPEKAIDLFEQSIAANPENANPYYGEAVAFESMGENDKALRALSRLFAKGKIQDSRSEGLFNEARRMFKQFQSEQAIRNESDAFKCIQRYRTSLESLSGYPIRIQETDFSDNVGARIEMAWRHGREYHLINTRRGFPKDLLSHLEAHELTHLKFESEARSIGKNLSFVTSQNTRGVAINSISNEMSKLAKKGYSEQSISQAVRGMIDGLCGFLYNCPVDMLIERHIHKEFNILHPAQYLSTSVLAAEAWISCSDPKIQILTPRKIMRASLAMNGAYSIFLDDLFQGATAFSENYKKTDAFEMAQKLYNHWQSRSDSLTPGDEYELVDDWADMLKLKDWYEWHLDSEEHDITAKPVLEGTTNPELLKEKNPAAVFYFMDVLRRFDMLTNDKIRDIAFEVGVVGMNGLDYSDPEKKYKLKALPDETFSGLFLMCLMYAGFQRIAPGEDCGMDLHDAYLTALQMHQHGE
ncbi:tetratricopeptide repeat protein [Pontiella sulfatireligans]|uniref:Uncharacterized protein n=1 Tax=Pontiella sulfatireligans TaxID=2750658 RepID=A0A6C2UK73_9BACT|nr:tetratricopeptide repeat protein [Pontiella sulfatireligans]VGO19827.1 hypothetical protein SCARR_01887 [Pontiella sulfatireligans]